MRAAICMTDDKEQIEISTISHIVYYGTAHQFSRLRGQTSSVFKR